jgi:RimJ/RimL family protein N-acetyltransferase
VTGEKRILTSKRLELMPMDLPLLGALADGDWARAELVADLRVPQGIELKTSAIVRRIHQLEEDASLLPWLMRAMVLRESRRMCGRIGFHSAPGADYLKTLEPDGVELGYEVDPRFRRQGYAKEAAVTLMKWAYDSFHQRCFLLSISPANAASLAMAASLGFQEFGSQIDEEDGLELYFRRRLDGWPAEWQFAGG